MSDVDDFIAAIAPRTREVPVCPRGDLISEHERLEHELAAQGQDESLGGSPRARELATEIAALEDEIDGSSRVFTVRGVGRRKWADLLAAHPPTKDDTKVGLDHNGQTFPAAALAACCDDLTEAQARDLADHLPSGEWLKLWNAMLVVNLGDHATPKSRVAEALLRANGRSATTSDPEASLAEPS